MKKDIFDNEEIETKDIEKLRINHEYAAKFNKRRDIHEVIELEQKYGKEGLERMIKKYDRGEDITDSDSEESDSDGELATKEVDAQILKTIGLIRSKDRKIYNSEYQFFDCKLPNVDENSKETNREDQQPKLNLRAHLIKQEEKNPDDEIDSTPTIKEQSNQLLSNIKDSINMGLSGTNNDDVFTIKKKSKKEFKRENKLYKKYLLSTLKNEGVDMTMKEWFEMGKKTNDDDFLVKYILGRKWIDKSDKDNEIDYEEEEADLEDEEIHEKLETIHNLRHENVNANLGIQTHSRHVEGVVRRSDIERKDTRKKAIERKKERKRQMVEDIKRYKAGRRHQLEDKLKLLEEIGGKDVAKAFNVDDFEDDFDPIKFDEKMSTIFNESYYENQDENPDLLETQLDNIYEDELPDKGAITEDNDNLMINPLQNYDKLKEIAKDIIKVKNEYQKAGYEGHLPDGTATRFNYTRVAPSTFGLKVKDILTSTDGLLNTYVPLKKVVSQKPTEEQEKDIERYSIPHRVKKFYKKKYIRPIPGDPQE